MAKFVKLHPCRCEVCGNDFNADDEDLARFHRSFTVLCPFHQVERWFEELTGLTLRDEDPLSSNRLKGIIW